MESTTDRHTGEYAGPFTRRAMDYDGHTVIGVPISDAAPDGSCYFITIDRHMQIIIGSVLSSSMTPYEPPEPPREPECTAAELADTRARLEKLLKMQLDAGISSIGDLRACAITMSDLADVIQIQGAQAARAPGQALDGSSSPDVPSAERSADAEHSKLTYDKKTGEVVQ